MLSTRKFESTRSKNALGIPAFNMSSVFRFAPSPNGHLHLGHAFSALLNAEAARQSGGRLLLRIEDIDIMRCRPALAVDIFEDLAWLGLRWEEPVLWQSRNMPAYRGALDKLAALGLLYPSLASRKQVAEVIASIGPLWPRDPEGAPHHPRALLPDDADRVRLLADEPRALRLDMAKALALAPPLFWNETGEGMIAADPARWGDVILARKEFAASYHIAVVVDDAAQGVTEVIRGRDLYQATALHRLLQHLLGLPAPLYRHHALVEGAGGEKLSKSLASRSLRSLRAEGVTPAMIRERFGLPD
jgi:glutamyl-Q tRNA(Asp) synthetase